MRKFLPVLFSGLLAVSFSQLAAAQTTSTDTKASGTEKPYSTVPTMNLRKARL